MLEKEAELSVANSELAELEEYKVQWNPAKYDHLVITTTFIWPRKMPINFPIKTPRKCVATNGHFFNCQRAYFFVFNLVTTTTGTFSKLQ